MNSKQRNTNMELLRIVSMFMIVLSHYMYHAVMHTGQAGAFEIWETGTTMMKFLTSSCVLGQIGVGLFFSITGYFSIERKELLSLKGIISEVIFYALFSVAVMVLGIVICGYTYESKGDFILLFLQTICVPVTGSLWWFVTAYIVLILFSKNINCFVSFLNENGYLVVIVLVGVFGLLFGELGSSFHDLEKAIFFYLIGGFFRLYIEKKRKLNLALSGVLVFLLVVINGGLYYNVCIHANDTILRKLFSMLCIVIEPFLVSTLFYLFLNFKIRTNTLINRMASFTFGIYLFHEAPYTRRLLWNRVFCADKYYSAGGGLFLIYSIIVVISVFVLGMTIDYIRQKFVEKRILFIIEGIVEKLKNVLCQN